MSICDVCNIEAKFFFICPECGGRFCKEHRKPEHHNCQKIQAPLDISVEEQTVPTPVLESSTSDHTPDEASERIDLEEVLFTDKITAPIIGEENVISELVEETKEPISIPFDRVTVELDEVDSSSTEDLIEIEETQDKNQSLIAQLGTVKTPLAILIIVSLLSGSLMGVLIYPSVGTDLQQRYDTLYEYYTELYANTQTLQAYYENITRQHTELKEEYIQLNSLYTSLVESNSELKKEYNDIINYQKNIQLATKQTITISPKQNHTLTYEIPFSGFITVNYTANGEAYVWVGSTSIEDSYYSRNPQFPDTASSINFTVPVQPDLLVYFANPDEFNSVEITFWISFIY